MHCISVFESVWPGSVWHVKSVPVINDKEKCMYLCRGITLVIGIRRSRLVMSPPAAYKNFNQDLITITMLKINTECLLFLTTGMLVKKKFPKTFLHCLLPKEV